MEKVSVIIPIYNAEKYIKQCIESLTNQTYKNIEIILINDGSTDNSKKICDEYRNKDNRVIVIDKENEGVSKTRNKGIELATGEYITFLDADDSINFNYIEELVKNIEDDCLVRFNNPNIKENIILKDEYIKQIAIGKIQGVCWGYLLKKSLLENMKFDTNTSYMEDTIFIINCLFKVSKVKFARKAFYNYNQNEGSLTQNISNIEKRLNGYIYSLDIVNKLLHQNGYNYELEINKRKLKLLESEFAKVTDKKNIEKLLENENVKTVAKQSKVSLEYKVFVHLIKKQKAKCIWTYIQIRNKMKKLVKRK